MHFQDLSRIACVACFALITFCSFSCSPHSEQSTQRPKDFPVILIAPPNAYNICYWTQENNKGTGADAGIRYLMKDPYPAKAVLRVLENHFKEKGWIQLKRNPLSLLGQSYSLNEWEYVEGAGNPKENRHQLFEYWVDPNNNDSVDILMYYGFPIGGPENKIELRAEIAYFGKKALREHNRIKLYRIFYPEELPITDSNALKRPENFPGIIVEPPNAFKIRYILQQNKTGADAFMLCSVEEPYPAKSVIEFLENHFKAKGWLQLKHDPLNAHWHIFAGDYLKVNEWSYGEKVGNLKSNQSAWQEFWVDPQTNNSIRVHLTYYSLIDGPENKTKLDILINYSGQKQSLQYRTIERYRTKFPEEFDPNYKGPIRSESASDEPFVEM